MARDVWNRGGNTNAAAPYDQGLQVAPTWAENQKETSGSDGLQVDNNQGYPAKGTASPWLAAYEGKETGYGVDNQAGLEVYRRGPGVNAGGARPQRRRLCLGLLAGAVVLIVIIIAVIVAVVVTRNHKDNAQPATISQAPAMSQAAASTMASTAASTPVSTSKPATPSSTSGVNATSTGVFNGSGLAAMGTYAGDLVWLISQRYTGEVQLSRLDTTGTWNSPKVLELQNVMNGTFLDAVSYVVSNEIFYHIFYIDTSGTIQQSTMTNQTNQWEPGNIGKMGWKAGTNPMSMMKSWWNFNNFGTTHGVGGGLRLYAGADDGLLHEYSYDQASNSWAAGYIFDGVNGAGGVGITQNGNSTLLHLLNSQNQIELWWWNQLAANAYPAGAWTKGVDSSASVLPNSAVTLDGVVYFQDPSSAISTVQFTGFETSERWNEPIVVSGISAIPGTRLSCLSYSLSSGDSQTVHVYLQSNGSNIVEFVQNQNTGPATNIVYLPLS